MVVSGRRGFTLIELMVVIAIIAIIAAFALPSLLRSRISANEASAISTLRSANSAELQFHQSEGTYVTVHDLVDLSYLALAPYYFPPGPPASPPPDPWEAGAQPGKSGYVFISGAHPFPGNGATEAEMDAAIKNGYFIFAVPQIPGETGARLFYTNTSGVIRWRPEVGAGQPWIPPPGPEIDQYLLEMESMPPLD